MNITAWNKDKVLTIVILYLKKWLLRKKTFVYIQLYCHGTSFLPLLEKGKDWLKDNQEETRVENRQSLVLLKSNDNSINMRLSENVGSNEAFIILFEFSSFLSALQYCEFKYMKKSFISFGKIFMNLVKSKVKIHQKKNNNNSVPNSQVNPLHIEALAFDSMIKRIFESNTFEFNVMDQ